MPDKLKRNLSTPELRAWWAAVAEAAKTAPKLTSHGRFCQCAYCVKMRKKEK